MDVAVICDSPRCALEGFSGFEALKGALYAHKDLLVEIRHTLVNLTKPLPNVLREKVETYNRTLVRTEDLTIDGGAPGNAIRPPTK